MVENTQIIIHTFVRLHFFNVAQYSKFSQIDQYGSWEDRSIDREIDIYYSLKPRGPMRSLHFIDRTLIHCLDVQLLCNIEGHRYHHMLLHRSSPTCKR